MIKFIIIYGTIIMIVLVIALICFFIGKYQAKVNESTLNDLFSKIDHVKNYKNNLLWKQYVNHVSIAQYAMMKKNRDH